MVVYRALSGRLPFEAATLTDKFVMATTAPRPSLIEHRPDLPLDIDHWISEAMSIDRDHRFTTIRAAWNALLASLETDVPLMELPTQPSNPPPDAPVTEVQAGGLFGAWRAVTTAVRRFALGGEEAGPLGSPLSVGEASLVTQLLQQSELKVDPSSAEAQSKERVMDAEAPTVSAPPVLTEAAPGAFPPVPPVAAAPQTSARSAAEPVVVSRTFEVEPARPEPAPPSLGPEKTLPTGQAPPKAIASRREHTLPIEKPKSKKPAKRARRPRRIKRDPLAAWIKRSKVAKKPRRSRARKKKGKRPS